MHVHSGGVNLFNHGMKIFILTCFKSLSFSALKISGLVGAPPATGEQAEIFHPEVRRARAGGRAQMVSEFVHAAEATKSPPGI